MSSISYNTRKTPLMLGENPNDWIFEKHEYDIDVIEIYKKSEKFLRLSAQLKSDIKIEGYLNNFKYGIQTYCKGKNIDFDFHFSMGYLIIPSNESYYLNCLGIALIYWDSFKIRAFLNFQKDKHPEKDLFINLVEFEIYAVMMSHNPFKNISNRQAIIMQWVEEEREKAKGSAKKTKTYIKEKNIPASIEDLFIDKVNLLEILKILQSYDIIDENNTWKGITNKNTEALALIDVLKEKSYIRKYPQTLIGKLFCKKFNLKMSDRSLRTKTQVYYDYYDEYKKIIPDLKKPYCS